MKMVDPPQHHSNNTQEEDDGSVASNENNSMNIKFPLSTSALNFCSVVDNEQFVRLTALNICLNILKLTSEYVGRARSEATSRSNT